MKLSQHFLIHNIEFGENKLGSNQEQWNSCTLHSERHDNGNGSGNGVEIEQKIRKKRRKQKKQKQARMEPELLSIDQSEATRPSKV